MKDLDFDELDRAVSSILGGAAPKTSGPTITEESLTKEPPVQTVSTAPTPEIETPESQLPKKQLVEKRPAGRFMDVMHETSAMRKSKKPVVSRQAATVKPLPGDAMDDGVPEVSTPRSVESTPEGNSPLVQEAVLHESAVMQDMVDAHSLPDPLDFHNFSLEDDGPAVQEDPIPSQEEVVSVDTPPLDQADEIAAQGVADLMADLEQEALSSLDTPFLNARTVEKRPLGAFSTDAVDAIADPAPTEGEVAVVEMEPSTMSIVEKTSEETEAGDPPEVEAVEAVSVEREAQTITDSDVIPEELQGDIVTVEATDVIPEPEAPSEVVEVEGAPNAIGGSIPQQYAEKTLSEVSEPTPVFDTTQYHQPLRHVPQQKSGWLRVVIITLFILAGVGAGAAVFFFDPFGLL